MSNEIEQLAFDITAIDAETGGEACAAVLERLDAMKARIREAEALLEARLVWWIRTTGRPVVIGPRRYYVGTKHATRCADVPGALAAGLEAAGGDLAGLAALLAAQPFRPGACRLHLPDDAFGRLFVTVATDELREGAAPRERLLVADDRFQGKREG